MGLGGAGCEKARGMARDAELGAAAGGCAPAARGKSGAESREAGEWQIKNTSLRGVNF